MIFFLFVVSEDTNQIPLDHKPSVVIDNQPLVNEDIREDSEDEHQGFVAHHLNDQQSVQHQVNQDFLNVIVKCRTVIKVLFIYFN
jgi:hypothetical protein